MTSFRSLSEMYIQEQVKANVLSTLVESRRKSLDTLTRENETLRHRADQLQKKIMDLEAEIEEENEHAKSRNKRSDVEMLLEKVLKIHNNKQKTKAKNKSAISTTKDTKTQTEFDDDIKDSDCNTSSCSKSESDEADSSNDTREDTLNTSTDDDVTQGEASPSRTFRDFPNRSGGNRGRTMVDFLSTILPPSPNDEQVRAYLTLLGHSKVTEAFATLLHGSG